MQPQGPVAVGACLAAILGVDIGVAYLIAGVCSASCLSVPVVCAACVGAIATMGGASIAGIIACFKLL